MTDEAGSSPPTEPRFLLIDEDASDRASVASVLSTLFPGSELQEVGRSTDFFHALKSESFDVVVTELGMKWAHWLFLFEAIRALQPKAAIVVFTRDENRESALAALNAGAAEYVVKSSRGYLNLSQAVDKLLINKPHRAEEPVAAETKAAASPSEAPDLVFEPEVPPDPQPEPEPALEPESTEAEEDKSDTQPLTASRDEEEAEEPEEAVEPTRASLGSKPQRSSTVFSVLSMVRRSVAEEARVPLAIGGALVVAVAFLTGLLLTPDGNQPAPEGQVLAESAEAQEAPETDGSSDPARAEPRAGSATPRPRAVPTHRGEAPLTLELQATDDVWVRLFIDGRQVLNTNMEAGQVRSFEGQRNADLTIGNAAGLIVFWNGADLGPLGGPGEPRRFHFWPTKTGRGPLPPGGWL